MVRESKNLCWAADTLAMESAMSLRVKEEFLIIFPFAPIPKQENMAMPKLANPDHGKLPERSFLEQLGTQLDNLRGITQLCIRHVGIHRPKENDNHCR